MQLLAVRRVPLRKRLATELLYHATIFQVGGCDEELLHQPQTFASVVVSSQTLPFVVIPRSVCLAFRQSCVLFINL